MRILKLTKPPEIEICYRYDQPIDKYPKITKPEQIYEMLRMIWNAENICHHEEMIILMMNTGCRVLGYHKAGVGGIGHVSGDPRIVFQAALKANASAIVIAHNHPSGDKKPSRADIRLAKRMSEIGDIIGISVLENVIMTPESYKSIR